MVDGIPVVVYTDGGCIGNPGPGGWAAILKYGSHEKELTGKFRHTTNNRMELRATIEALEAIKRPLHVVIFTDSTYVQNGITRWVHRWQQNNWRTAQKKPVKNRDLWQRLLAAVERHRTAGGVEWRWTKGHAGDKYNERADDLANSAARSVSDLDPLDEEKGPSPPLTGSLFGNDPIT